MSKRTRPVGPWTPPEAAVLAQAVAAHLAAPNDNGEPDWKAMGALFAPPRLAASCRQKAFSLGLMPQQLAFWSPPPAADDSAMVAQLVAEGGFPRLSERRGPNGRCVACLPLVWDCRPQEQAA